MAVVTVTVNGKNYDVGCQDAQVSRIEALGRYLDERANTIAGQVGAVPEAKMLIMVSLMLCDEIFDMKEQAQPKVDEGALAQADESIALAVEALSARIESIAERLERP